MVPDRYYCTEIREGPKTRRFYFYAGAEGLTGPEYGYTEADSWVDLVYEAAVREVRERQAVKPFSTEAGAVSTPKNPRELSPDELVRQDPWVNVYVVNAIKLAKREIGDALHPIKVTWYWETSGEPREEEIVHLKLADHTGVFGAAFGLQQLGNEPLMKGRIRRLYQDLLELRSRTLIMNLLRANVGAGKN